MTTWEVLKMKVLRGSLKVTIDVDYHSTWLGDLALTVATSDYGR